MTAKLPSTDPKAGLCEHAQCGGVWKKTSECGRKKKKTKQRCCRVQWVPAPGSSFYPDSTEQPVLRKPKHLRLGSADLQTWDEWMYKLPLAVHFNAKQVDILFLSYKPLNANVLFDFLKVLQSRRILFECVIFLHVFDLSGAYSSSPVLSLWLANFLKA